MQCKSLVVWGNFKNGENAMCQDLMSKKYIYSNLALGSLKITAKASRKQ